MRIPIKIILGATLFLCGTSQMVGQDDAMKKEGEVEVQRHTVMDKFGAEMILTAEERRQLKLAHLLEIEKLKIALDTMDISRRKKRKILADLVNKPYSDRVNRALAEITFSDEDEIIED